MTTQIIHIGNDLNKVSWGSLSAQESNLLIEVLYALTQTEDCKIRLTKTQLHQMIPFKHLTDAELLKVLIGLKDHFFGLHFERLIGGNILECVNLFRVMRIHKDQISLELEVEPRLRHLILNVTAQFTRLELAEFSALQNKYSKTLYRLLKQYRTQGWMQITVEEFRRLLEIPQSYRVCHIEQKIINPAINELSWPDGMRDMIKDVTSPLYHHTNKPAFRELRVTKIKDKQSRGRGGKVTAFRFEFRKERQLKTYEANLANKMAQDTPTAQSVDPAQHPPMAEGIGQIPVAETHDPSEAIAAPATAVT